MDGWGAIRHPAGSFDVLRVKTTLAGRDSINLDSLSLQLRVRPPPRNGIQVARQRLPRAHPPDQHHRDLRAGDHHGSMVLRRAAQRHRRGTVDPVALPRQYGPRSRAKRPAWSTVGGFLCAGEHLLHSTLGLGERSFHERRQHRQYGQRLHTASSTPPFPRTRLLAAATASALSPPWARSLGEDNGVDITIGLPPIAMAAAFGTTTFCNGGDVLLQANAGYYHLPMAMDGSDMAAGTPTLPIRRCNGQLHRDRERCVRDRCERCDRGERELDCLHLDADVFTACEGETITITAADLSGKAMQAIGEPGQRGDRWRNVEHHRAGSERIMHGAGNWALRLLLHDRRDGV